MTNDLLAVVNVGAFWIPMFFSSAFDTTGHSISFNHSQQRVDVRESTLEPFQSYFFHPSLFISYPNTNCSVPSRLYLRSTYPFGPNWFDHRNCHGPNALSLDLEIIILVFMQSLLFRWISMQGGLCDGILSDRFDLFDVSGSLSRSLFMSGTQKLERCQIVVRHYKMPSPIPSC